MNTPRRQLKYPTLLQTQQIRHFCRAASRLQAARARQASAIRRLIARLICFILILSACVQTGYTQVGSPPSQLAAHKHILILVSSGYGRPGVDLYIRSFFSALTNGGMSVNDISVEYLDLTRHSDKEFRDRKRAILLHQYAGQRIDLIVAGQQPALNFLLEELKDLAPGVPVIVAGATVPPGYQTSRHRFLEQTINLDFKGTIEGALELFPDTRHVVAAIGSGDQDLATKSQIQQQVTQWKGKLDFEYTDGLSIDEIMKRVANLPPRTVILYGNIYKDKTGADFVPLEAGIKIAKTANAPIFGPYVTDLGLGIIGGSVVNLEREGTQAGHIALDIVNGKMHLKDSLTQVPSQSVPMFDWQQIERWEGGTTRLPPDAIFINRPPTLWSQYRNTVISTLAVFATLIFLIACLLIENRRRKLAEILAKESEARFRVLVEQAPEAIFVFDTDLNKIVDVNNHAEILTGRPREELLLSDLERLYAPAQPDNRPITESAPDYRRKSLAGEEVVFERRLITASGEEVHCEVRLVRLPSANRNLLRASFIDITERKRTEEVLRKNEEQQRFFVRDVLTSATDGKLLICYSPRDLPDGPPDAAGGIVLDAETGLRTLRQRANEAGLAGGLSEERLQDLMIAVGEAGMNAIVHAGGGYGYVCSTTDGIQVWVVDRGRGISVANLPQATLRKGFTTAGSFGHGMKMMLHTVDRIYLLTGSEGTTVIIEQGRTPPPPERLVLGW